MWKSAEMVLVKGGVWQGRNEQRKKAREGMAPDPGAGVHGRMYQGEGCTQTNEKERNRRGLRENVSVQDVNPETTFWCREHALPTVIGGTRSGRPEEANPP